MSGTGFAFTREILDRIGSWHFFLLTEDIEFTIDNVVHGEKIGYCREAVLYDEQPTDFRQSWRQRLRWSRGYLQVFGRYGLDLMKGMFGGSFSCYDMAMNIMPAAVLSCVSIVVNVAAAIQTFLAGGDLSGLMEGGETGAFWKYTEKFLIALAFILAAAALVWLGVRVYRLIRKGVLRLLEKLRGVTKNLGEDYVDEQESLDWGEMSRGVKDELKKRLERLTRREKKWTEMDAREKVRYVVRRMYKRAGGGLSSLTIREAASQLPRGSASEEEVASLYEQARYAETAPTQEQAERLRRDVKP